jgi:hypothetical protein
MQKDGLSDRAISLLLNITLTIDPTCSFTMHVGEYFHIPKCCFSNCFCNIWSINVKRSGLDLAIVYICDYRCYSVIKNIGSATFGQSFTVDPDNQRVCP